MRLPLAAIALVAVAAHAASPGIPTKIAPEAAKARAGALFPAQCGRAGERCAVAYDDRRGCLREFVVTFPVGVKHAEPVRAWITLDASGAVREVVALEPASCRPGATR